MIIDEKIPKNNQKEFWLKKISDLIEMQKEKWELLKNNYENLSSIKTREFEFENKITKRIIVQFNPHRIKSTTADLNENVIQNRKCFLCTNNLPEEQDGLIYNKNFLILVNPYPILKEHLTISKIKHTPQTIISHFHDLLDLTEDLSENFTIVYNGPKCGASAPDHMHFQAITKNVLPVEKYYEALKEEAFIRSNQLDIYIFENAIVKFISFESKNKIDILYAFKVFLNAIKKLFSEEEPMINLISSFYDEKFRLIIFPRLTHRPKQYYFDDNRKLLVSPAAIDLGGIIITVREEDFNKITRNDIIDVYNQVTFAKEYFEYIKKKLNDAFQKNN